MQRSHLRLLSLITQPPASSAMQKETERTPSPTQETQTQSKKQQKQKSKETAQRAMRLGNNHKNQRSRTSPWKFMKKLPRRTLNLQSKQRTRPSPRKNKMKPSPPPTENTFAADQTKKIKILTKLVNSLKDSKAAPEATNTALQ